MPLAQALADRLDALLRTSEIPDYPGAINGLQLANRRDVRRLATAVDFSSFTVQEAIRAQADMLLVHHGMFWGGAQPITGAVYQRIAALVTSDVAVYSSHLPLDIHPEVGNNVLLAKRLGLEPSAGFARFKTIEVGVSGAANIPTQALVDRACELAAECAGAIVATPYSADRLTRHWGICTGAGADSDTLREATERGIDTMIVGEGPHHTAVQARDLGIVIIYAGHYATETLGIRALGERIASEFGIESRFLDAPTGL
ncbi:MAG TPA: Nif3-like dinuclear metal center hexameric protein [Gemmatimonadaceae bacterium]|jgi:dinuclear metal center YbgI/SA1388 family protein